MTSYQSCLNIFFQKFQKDIQDSERVSRSSGLLLLSPFNNKEKKNAGLIQFERLSFEYCWAMIWVFQAYLEVI